jgi:hypothetical protein
MKNSELLIRGFGVYVPGGASRSSPITPKVFYRPDRPSSGRGAVRQTRYAGRTALITCSPRRGHPRPPGRSSGSTASLRAEFDTRQVFASLTTARQALDEWVAYYEHPAAAPGAGHGHPRGPVRQPAAGRAADLADLAPDRSGEDWVARKVGPNSVVCVSPARMAAGNSTLVSCTMRRQHLPGGQP